ncbi:MAG TPA: GvpL/GvpF family gas vesicle protein [Blastocatellia bacterium]|nr:GvpL/GvpF family gas vesicle protein [Blastocatellia bacterium]
MRTPEGEQKEQPDETGPIYAYCVGESAELVPLFGGELPDAIEPGSRLEPVIVDQLAAVVSSVPLADYGKENLEARLEDPAWTAMRAIRHQRVVEYFSARASIVPLRFGVLYFHRDGVARMLSEKSVELLKLSERLRGRQEWGIGIYKDEAKLRDMIASVSPTLRDLDERAATATPGEAYLLRKKIDSLRITEARAEARRVVSSIETALRASSESVLRLDILKEETEGRRGMAARFAFLVDKRKFDHFRDEAERAANEYEPLGFQIELTGPYPAYNFAGL